MHRLTGTMLKELHFHKLLLANHTFLHISFIFTVPVRVKCRGFYFHSRPAVRALFGCWTAVGWLRCGGCPKGSYSPSESHQSTALCLRCLASIFSSLIISSTDVCILARNLVRLLLAIQLDSSSALAQQAETLNKAHMRVSKICVFVRVC